MAGATRGRAEVTISAPPEVVYGFVSDVTSASTETPSGGLVDMAADEFRAWMRTMFTDLAAQAGAVNPTNLGRQFHLICDGAGLAGRMDRHDSEIRLCARDAVEAVLHASLASRPQRTSAKVRPSAG